MSGFLGFNKFDREGPGIAKDEYEGNRFIVFFKIFFGSPGKFFLLNILYIICCIPVVTIGPATAGMTYVLRNLSERKPVFVRHDFFKSFKRNAKQSIILFIIDLVVYTLLAVALMFYSGQAKDNGIYYVFCFVCVAALLIFTIMNYYLWLMTVTVTLPLKKLFKNAFLLTFAGAVTNIITSFFMGITVVAFYYLVFAVPFWGAGFFFAAIILWIIALCFIFSFIGFLICYNSYPYIKKYVIDPYYEEHPEEKKQKEESIFIDRTWEQDEL